MSRRPVSKSRRLPRIGTRLRMLRESRFLTQDELAQIIGVQAGNLSRWERNESGPYFRHLRALAEYFGVEPASLVEPDDRPIAA